MNITSLDFPVTIDDYLDKSSGYQSAHSFPACYPPRQIIYCTTTLIEFSKCSWLQEVSTVYGIEPNLQCIRGESLYRCLDDVSKNVADLVLIDQDERLTSEIKFNLTSLLYEYSSDFEQNYVTIAVIKASSSIENFSGGKIGISQVVYLISFCISDLKDKIACFPNSNGAAYSSAADALQKLSLVSDNCTSSVEEFFSTKTCFGNKNCKKSFGGDNGPFHCLREFGDVAFMNLETFKNLTGKNVNCF